jgi:hypothetical protein
VSSTMLFLDENFYMPDEVIKSQKAKLQLWHNLNKSLTNITPCPIKQFFPIETNSHIKEWLEILVLLLILTHFVLTIYILY